MRAKLVIPPGSPSEHTMLHVWALFSSLMHSLSKGIARNIYIYIALIRELPEIYSLDKGIARNV